MVQDDKQAEEAAKQDDGRGPTVLEQIVWVVFGMIFAGGMIAAVIAEAAR